MSSLSPTKTVSRWERDELRARGLACSLLVKGCEGALFRFGLEAAETAGSREASIGRRAAEITREILRSWRQTRDSLRGLDLNQPDAEETLAGWLHVDPSLADDQLAASRAFFDRQSG